jgi:type II secretory pathway pseudopilin PulG
MTPAALRHKPLRRSCMAKCRPGFSLLESAVSVLLVGVLLVAALQSSAAARRRETATVDQLSGRQLAGELINEILLQAYKEPESDENAVFGPEPGEATGHRALFDDVDDYAHWSESPPRDRYGSPLPGWEGWTRLVQVHWADPVTLAPTATPHTGLKRITVTVSRQGQIVAAMTGYRSQAWTNSIPSPSDATGNRPPVAVATSNNLNRKVGQSVSFDGSASSDPDGDYLSHVWDFGNGATGTGPAVSHAYSAPGSYNCTLTVYDGRGGMATATLTAVISP